MTFDKRLGSRGTSSRASSLWAHGVGFAVILASTLLAACEGCRGTGGPTPSSSAQGGGGASAQADAGVPTLRFYLVSDLAGALEPCGCTKDQLGGVDHLAAWIHAEQPKAKA